MNKTGRIPYQGRTTSKHQALLVRVLVFQILLTLATLICLYVFVGLVAAYSALIGGVIYLIPNAYQLRHIVASDNSNNLGDALRGIYKSEIWKMALTAILFALAFGLVRPIEPFSLFGVFVLLQLIAVFSTLLNKPVRKRG